MSQRLTQPFPGFWYSPIKSLDKKSQWLFISQVCLPFLFVSCLSSISHFSLFWFEKLAAVLLTPIYSYIFSLHWCKTKKSQTNVPGKFSVHKCPVPQIIGSSITGMRKVPSCFKKHLYQKKVTRCNPHLSWGRGVNLFHIFNNRIPQ